jgi:hypothetical protein
MSRNLPIISDWSQLRGMDPLPSRIVWERDGKEMAGNLFEYTSSFYLAYTGARIEHPAFNETLRVARGGSWDFIALGAHPFTRLALETTVRHNFEGFRCASAPF